MSLSRLLPRVARTVLAVATLAIGIEVQAASEWRTISRTIEYRSEGALVTRGDSAWLFNGFDRDVDIQPSVERYDVRSNRWTLLGGTSTSRARANAVTHNGTVRVGDEVWLIGGRVGDHPGRVSDQVWIYDLDDGDWRRGPTLPGPFAGGGAALVNGRIHVFGGLDPQARCDVSTHHVLDLARPGAGWRTLGGAAAMPKPRNHFATAVVDGVIYAIGGQHGHDRCPSPANRPQLRFVHAFDPATGRWTRRADLPFPQSHAEPSTFAHDGRVWTIGGTVRQHATKVMVYDPATNRWQERRELALKRPLLAPGAAIFGERLFLFGGGAPRVQAPIRDTQVITLSARDVPPATPPLVANDDPTPVSGRAEWRINVGGPALTDAAGRRWLADAGSPSGGYTRGASRTWSGARGSVARRDVSADVPIALFATERYGHDRKRGLSWEFPVTPGRHEVRLHFAENWSGAFAPRRRVFDVLIEGELVADDVDVFAAVGARAALTRSFVVSSDARLSLGLRHVVQNPALKGIEIVRLGSGDDGVGTGANGGASGGAAGDTNGGTDGGTDDGATGGASGGTGGGTGDDAADGASGNAAPAELVESGDDVDFGDIVTGTRGTRTLGLTNAGGSPLTVTALAIDGASADDFTATLVGSREIGPGETRRVEIAFRPVVDGTREAVLLISHDGPSMLGLVSLSGRALADATVTASGTRRVVHRVNVGGPALPGHDGIAWSGDLGGAPAFAPTTPSRRYATTRPIALGAEAVRERVPATVFATERFATSRAKGLAWRFDVRPGRHEVRLHVAEIWPGAFAAGRRTFDVLVEGERVADALDVFDEADGADRGLTRSFLVASDDGRLDLALRHVVQNPSVKGIEILECLDGCPAAR